MYTYPEYLNAIQRVALDLFARAHAKDPIRFPFPLEKISLTVAADSRTGTASVTWRVAYPGTMYERLYVTINMPVKPATYLVTESEFTHGIAYLLHEVGHPLHTDNAVWDAAVARRAHNLLNSLEDVREEKATIDLDLAVNATKMFGSLIDSLHAKGVANGYDPNDVRSIGWTLSLMGRFNNGYDMDVSDVIRKLDPNGTVASIMSWALDELALCQSTQDCLDLADKVTAAVLAAKQPKLPVTEPKETENDDAEINPEEDRPVDAEDQPDSDIDGPDEGSEVGDQGDDTGGSVTEYEPQHERSDKEPEPNAPVSEEKEGQGGLTHRPDDKQPEPQEPQPDADDLFDEPDLTPNRNETVTSSSRNYDSTRRTIEEVRRAEAQSFDDKPIAGRTTRYGYRGTTVDIVTKDASKMGRQRSLLAQALKKEDIDDYEGGRMSGRLNRRDLSKLTTGNPHIFGKRTVEEGYDTDVQILIDGSSSMENQRIMAAATLGLVVAQAAAQVGVDCTAHVFTDTGLHAITKGRAKPLARRFAYAYNQVEGSTPLTHNMLVTALEQKRRAPHKRRIMFVITDGGCDLGPDVLKAAGHYVEQVIGAEIANLHIGYKPMGIFRNECAVNVQNVPASGVQVLTNTLERGMR